MKDLTHVYELAEAKLAEEAGYLRGVAIRLAKQLGIDSTADEWWEPVTPRSCRLTLQEGLYLEVSHHRLTKPSGDTVFSSPDAYLVREIPTRLRVTEEKSESPMRSPEDVVWQLANWEIKP